MPIFDVQGPDGKAYQIDAPSMDAATSALTQIAAPKAANAMPFGATDELAHSATFGLTRPLYGATAAIGPAINQLLGRGGPTPSEAFTQAEQAYDAGRAAYAGEHPALSSALAVTGGLAALGPSAIGAGAQTATGRILQGAKIGGIAGGVQGAAGADGGLSDGLSGAATGALGGAAVGAAVPAAIETGRLATAPVRAMISAARDPEGTALRQVGRAMADDGISPMAAEQALRDAQAQGVRDTTLADVAGPNAQRLAAVYAKSPGPGKAAAMNFLEGRSATSGENVVDVLRPSLGNPETTYAAIDKLIADRAAAATPAYEKAMAEGAGGVWNRELQQLAAAPAIQAAAKDAMPALGNRGIAEGFAAPRANPIGFNPETGRAFLTKLPNGDTRVPDLRFWDQVKRELDGQITQAKNFGATDRVDELMQVKNRLLSALDKEVPSYKTARGIFESPSKSKEAIETGMKFLTMPPEQIRKVMAGLSTTDKEFARLGTVRAAQEMVGGPIDRMRQMTSPNMKKRLAEIFPDQSSHQRAIAALEKIKAQNDFSRTARGGSSTYENFAQAGDAQVDPGTLMNIGKDIGTGNILGLTTSALRGLSNRFGGITPDVANKGVDLLINPNAAQNQAALQAIQNAYLNARIAPTNLAAFQNGAVGAGIGLLGNVRRR